MPPPAGLKRFGDYSQLDAYNDFMEATVPAETAAALQERALEVEENTAADACTPYIMLYARGTTESGDLGATVGPALKAGLMGDKNWSVRGINSRDGYDASLNGIYCIGMDGGMACKGILEKMAAQCPTSKFVTAGYSQGAMVARICVAYASPEVKTKVVGVCFPLLARLLE
jgi:cutinase